MLNKESKEMEALFEDIRKAIIQIPRRKPIILKNPIIKGIKLSSIMLKHFETNYTMKPSGNFEVEKLMGLQVYRDENADVPRYIVEGELETELQQIKSAEPKEALKSLENLRIFINTEDELFDYEDFEMVEQVLIQGEQNRIKINNLLSYLEEEEIAIMGITNIDKYPNMKAELKLIKKIPAI